MSWTTYTVYNFADDLHWPELGILLESIDYHEAARKASFLGSMCDDSLMAAIHFERRFDALMKYVINSQEHPIGKVKDFIYRVEFKISGSCRVSSGQGKVREIPDLAKVREKSGNFVEGQGKNEFWEKSGNLHLVQSK